MDMGGKKGQKRWTSTEDGCTFVHQLLSEAGVVPDVRGSIASADLGCLAATCPKVHKGVEAKGHQGTIFDTAVETKYRLLILLSCAKWSSPDGEKSSIVAREVEAVNFVGGPDSHLAQVLLLGQIRQQS